MTKRKLRTTANYTFKASYATKTTKDSLTVPGESYTVQQLLERTHSGVPLNALVKVKDEYYASEEDFDTFTHDGDLDIVDIHNLAEESADTIKRSNEEQAKAKAKKSAKQRDEAVKPPVAQPPLEEPKNEP